MTFVFDIRAVSVMLIVILILILS